MSDFIGKSLGRYHILEQLGEGGMATVYKAYDTRLETDVAVKVIRIENILPSVLERSLKRFEREAKSLARLNHPNIVKVTDYGEYEGKPYLVMPYFPGGTLKQKMGKPIAWQEAIQILLPIAEALDYAHSQNMIHRDVKPANILLAQRGQPMLSDFGIAKILDLDETLDLTGTNAAIGTPEYMAPEQATAKTVDHRVDIYSLGIVLYEMVTGRKPFMADTPMAVLIMHAHDPLPSPKKFVPDLPDKLAKVLLKALEKKPENRYQSIEEFAVALKGLLGDKTASQSISVPLRRNVQEKDTIKDFAPETPTRTEKISISSVPISRRGVAWFGVISIVVVVLMLVSGLPALLARPESTLTGIAVVITTPSSVNTNTLSPTEQILRRYDIPTDGFYSIGPDDAPIVIVEFSDFQCPFCKRWHDQAYQPLMAAYPGKIRLVYRNLPLTSIHSQAMPAAEASLCAGEQNAYWQYHEALFNGQEILSSEFYLQTATGLGLNLTAFQTCMDEHRYQSQIQQDIDFALGIGVQSTPTFFINGLAIVGAQPLSTFIDIIDKELAGDIPQ